MKFLIVVKKILNIPAWLINVSCKVACSVSLFHVNNENINLTLCLAWSFKPLSIHCYDVFLGLKLQTTADN